MKARRLANEKVRRLHTSGVKSSRAVNISQLRRIISNPLIKRKEENPKIKMNKFCKLANITNRHWWISLYVTSLTHKKKTKSKREYYKMKRARKTIRVTYLEEIEK